MGPIHDGSCVSSIISDYGLILGSTKNSTDTASKNYASLVVANFANASAFTFLDRGITSIEVMGNVSINPFAFSK